MAIMITDECINCGACEPECPNTAIYEGGIEWSMAEGTGSSDETVQKPISDEFYFIASDKCTECVGFHEEPQCAAVCPVDCCIVNPDRIEEKDILLKKKGDLHV